MVEHRVQSKAIRSVRYDDARRILEVEFESTSAYRYFDVPRDVYEWLLKVKSKGRFVNRLVKEKYRYEKIEPESAHEDIDLLGLLQQSLTDRPDES
jgi:hypothetical protein